MKVYVVLYSVGEYSDREVFIDKVFKSLDAAKQYVKSEEAKIRELESKRGANSYHLNLMTYWIESEELIEE